MGVQRPRLQAREGPPARCVHRRSQPSPCRLLIMCFLITPKQQLLQSGPHVSAYSRSPGPHTQPRLSPPPNGPAQSAVTGQPPRSLCEHRDTHLLLWPPPLHSLPH